jgi:hypothetical protein
VDYFSFWYAVPIKIWQPWGIYICRWLREKEFKRELASAGMPDGFFFIFKPKFPIGANFGGSGNGKGGNINYMAIMNVLRPFGIYI